MEYQEKLWEEEAKIREMLGTKKLLDNIEKALGNDMLEDILAYIARHYDIKTTLEEKK